MSRLSDLVMFYEMLEALEQRCGGKRLLRDCDGRQNWPQRGVYFFFERGEKRTQTGAGARVVRVGTHALKDGSRTTLWNRLSQHQGVRRTGGGNHRGSIFRLLAGQALIARDGLDVPTWGVGGDAGKAAARLGLEREQVKTMEQPIEGRQRDAWRYGTAVDTHRRRVRPREPSWIYRAQCHSAVE